MKFLDGAIERPMLVSLMAIAVGVVCAVAYFRLPLREVPDIQVPYVIVETDYPGAAPAEVESLVTRPIERKLGELEDIDTITSESVSGRSHVVIRFVSGTDTAEKIKETRDKVAEAKDDLPETATTPSAEEYKIINRPALFVFVYGSDDPYYLWKISEGLRDELETVNGCSSIESFGHLKREMRVQVDPDKLNSHLISIGEVIFALKQQNLDMPGGVVKTEDTGRIVRSIGQFKSAQEVGDVIVGFQHGGPIRVKDLAIIEDGLADVEEEFRVNGQRCVALSIYVRERADLVETVDRITEKLSQLRHTLPPGIQIETAGDMGYVIRYMTDQLKMNALVGGALVILVMMIGIGLRNSLMITLAIPFSILIAFGIMYALDISMTGVAIFSIILAMGLVVDGAIIVGENIYRHIEEGLPGVEAAKVGLHEVAGAVLSSDLTIIVAFLPMMFMTGPIGQYISVIPKVVAASVAGSIFVDHIILPTVAAKFMRPKVGKNRIPEKIATPHLRILLKALRHRRLTLGVAAAAFVVSLLLIPVIGTELFPKTDTSRLWISLQMPVGTTLHRTDAVARIVESRLENIPDIDKYACSVGRIGLLDTTFGSMSLKSENVVEFIVELVKEGDRERETHEIISDLRQMLADIPDAKIDIKQRIEGPPAGADVTVRIKGQDLDMLRNIAQDIAGKLKLIKGAADVRTDQEENQPEVLVNIDREDASSLGLVSEAISSTVAATIVGVVATTFRDQDEEINVRVQIPPSYRRDIDDIRNLRVLSPSSAYQEVADIVRQLSENPSAIFRIPATARKLVPLAQVAEIREAEGLTHISRHNLKRTATVRCNAEGRLASKVVSDLKAEIEGMPMPTGYSIEYAGENEDTVESFKNLGKAMAIAVLLVLMVLMAQFKSVIQPLVIIITIPLSFIGVILGLVVTGNPFGMMAFIGVVCLSGIVVNDAIVLITYANILRDKGIDKKAAIVQAAQTRIRPIMMTTITTVVDLLSTALGLGGGIDFWAPLGWSIIWGLMASTLLTLIVVPVIYSLIAEAEERIAKGKGHRT